MQKTGRHPHKALSSASVRTLKEPGRHADGGGLYLFVDASGAKRWVLRTLVRGHRRDIGLGSATIISLAEARDAAAALRKIARQGGDPLAERRRATILVPSFEEAARRVHGEHKDSWRNAKHAAQWLTTLETYAFPELGSRPVNQINSSDILRVLSPIWLKKPETARRVRQRIGTVLDWAKAAGYRTEGNPIDGLGKGLPKQPTRRNHHPAMAYGVIPGFIVRLRESDVSPSVRLGLEFLILNASRTGEVLGSRWEEIDWEAKMWTIPGSRMKAGIEHRIPLAPRSIEILEEIQALHSGDEHLFPGRTHGRALSNMAFAMPMRRLGETATVHGFRSSFRDWAAERTNFPREICEAALAHSVGNKVEAAYRRSDLIEKRRQLMEAWASSVSG